MLPNVTQSFWVTKTRLRKL